MKPAGPFRLAHRTLSRFCQALNPTGRPNGLPEPVVSILYKDRRLRGLPRFQMTWQYQPTTFACVTTNGGMARPGA